MIDPQAKPAPYIKLMALVILLGLITALVTFTFIVLVHRGTDVVWREAAGSLGIDLRLFTVLVCTIGGLFVGLLVKVFGDHSGIFAEMMLEFGKTGRFEYRNAPGIVITAFVSLISGASLGPEAPLADACGGIGTWLSDQLKLNDQETRTMGYSGVSGMLAAFITEPFGGALLGLESAQGGTSGKQTYFWVLFPSLLASAVSTVVFVLLSGTILRDVVPVPRLYSPADGFVLRRAAGLARRGGWLAFHAFPQTLAAALSADEGACGAARAARRSGHGDHRRPLTADLILGRGADD